MKANNRIAAGALKGVALIALIMMVVGIATAWAQDAVRIRGTIERLDGSTYVIKARDPAELKVALAANAQIAGVVKASLSDIKQGSFVGVTAMPKADGSQSALEVHIFSRGHARNRGRTLPVGSSAAEHNDQRKC